ncbi:tetratricopeptide repeat protein [Aliikangiella sp. IMCC44359]|uniref:tetratricopeptide repeat protein n=1 Tax=Aliikangiella sp. IMCC44359 TaxID=3459125 RepID=UPI00403AD281
MKYCKYHPKQLAAWSCACCKVDFCASCVPEDKQNYLPKCTLCRRSLASLSVAERIPPFWQKLTFLLGVPLNASSLLFICLFAFLLALIPPGLLGLCLSILLMLPVIEFLFESMEKIACGEKLNSEIKKYLMLENKSVFLKLAFIYAVLVAALSELYLISPTVGIFLSCFFILGIPASMIILMMEKSMFSMINPIKIGFIIKLFGSAYFVLYLIMTAIAIMVVKLNAFQLESGSLLIETLFYSIILYFSMIVFVMAGYLVYQYHFELNFTINKQTIYQVDESIVKDDMAEVSIFIQEGRYEEAQKLLLDKISENPRNYRANEKLILLYAIQGKNDFLIKIANRYFIEMIEAGKNKQAVDFFQKLHDRSIDFIPEEITVVIGVVSEMKNKHQFNIALNLIEEFEKKYPMPKGWESLSILKAQLLAEFANRSTEAIKVLEHVLKRSIEQDAMSQAESYLLIIKAY